MTHPASPAAPAPYTSAEAAPPRTPSLRDGDIVEIRGATMRVMARGTAPQTARPVAYLQPLTRPVVTDHQAATAPVLEASAALMTLIAEEFGIEEAQPHQLQPGQARWANDLVNDFNLLTAGARFHAVMQAGSPRPQGPSASHGNPVHHAPRASAQGA